MARETPKPDATERAAGGYWSRPAQAATVINGARNFETNPFVDRVGVTHKYARGFEPSVDATVVVIPRDNAVEQITVELQAGVQKAMFYREVISTTAAFAALF